MIANVANIDKMEQEVDSKKWIEMWKNGVKNWWERESKQGSFDEFLASKMGEPQKDGTDCQKRIWLVVWNIFPHLPGEGC